MAATSQNREKFEDYDGFVDKFKPKKTTDDCYTPELVYEAVALHVTEKYGISRQRMVRPFWPGGDYERFKYEKDSVVVDNPPFSIISGIVRWYLLRKIPFFLFTPALTVMGIARFPGVTAVFANAQIVYQNGARVNTAFVTSLSPELVMDADPYFSEMLNAAIKWANEEERPTKQLPKYEYPDEVITGAMINKWVKYGVPFSVRRKDARFIKRLDEQAGSGTSIYGGGFLLSERAAAERAAAERAAAERAAAKVWALSKRERLIVDELGKDQEGENDQDSY